ncbi:MAG: hypothetical protein SGILL_006567 [Bacillariaceae sp.]
MVFAQLDAAAAASMDAPDNIAIPMVTSTSTNSTASINTTDERILEHQIATARLRNSQTEKKEESKAVEEIITVKKDETKTTSSEVNAVEISPLPQTSLDVTKFVVSHPPTAKLSTGNSESNTLIIGFSDHGYKEIAWNWYQELEKLGHTSHFVVAQDIISAQYFQEKGMRHDYIHAYDIQQANFSEVEAFDVAAGKYTASPTNFTNFRKEKCRDYDNKYGNLAKQAQLYRRSLFGNRWTYVLRQLEAGYNVLLTDVDNVFVRYKDLKELEAEPFDSMHAFAGTLDAFPRNVFRQKGYTICGGMSWLRAAPGVMEIANQLIKRCGCESTLHCHCFCDDQVVFNNIMLMHDPYRIDWDQNITVPSTEEEMQWEEMTGTCPKTGHRVKIWDRDMAFRRGWVRDDPKNCPDPTKSWIAMPAGLDRVTVYQTWRESCPLNGTLATANSTQSTT